MLPMIRGVSRESTACRLQDPEDVGRRFSYVCIETARRTIHRGFETWFFMEVELHVVYM